uniref:Uncharacterized protein n=1 Tax=Manihot esculenta TaxID=3983 RepID=A0A2C9WG44_MANES
MKYIKRMKFIQLKSERMNYMCCIELVLIHKILIH